MKDRKSFAAFGFRIGTGQEEHVLRPMGPGGPCFLTIDNIVVAFANSRRRQGSQIRTRIRLAPPLAVKGLAIPDGGQQPLLLFIAGAGHERGRKHTHGKSIHTRSTVISPDLVENDLLHNGGFLSTKLLGPAHGEPAFFRQFSGHVGVEVEPLFGVVNPLKTTVAECWRCIFHFAFKKGLERLFFQLLFLGQSEIHFFLPII